MSAESPLHPITIDAVRRHLIAGQEIAIVDLRSEYEFALAHPLFAISIPLGRIEIKSLDLIPDFNTLVVLYDDGGTLIERAAKSFQRLGYRNIQILAGGLAGWVSGGGELFRDVNVPSKAFGELVAETRHTPLLPALELRARQAKGDKLVILDSRREEEYRTMAIPGGISLPGGELIKRALAQVSDTETTIVVNCAGRTRSIIGAQSLVNAGIANPVFALENGTIGWEIAGLPLELESARIGAPATAESLAEAHRSILALAEKAGIPVFGRAEWEAWEADTNRSLYRLDVRTPAEFLAGHLPGFRSAPGGQLVQATDEWVGVRHGRILLADDDGIRARAAAVWLHQLGWREVAVLDHALFAPQETGAVASKLAPHPAATPEPLALAALSAARQDYVVIDVTLFAAYRKAHIPGAYFAQPADLPAQLGALAKRNIVITCQTAALSPFVAADLAAAGLPVRWLAGGTRAWAEAGFALETGVQPGRALSATDDVYKRPYEGTDNASAAKQAYLDWEYGLVAQLARDGTHGFKVL